MVSQKGGTAVETGDQKKSMRSKELDFVFCRDDGIVWIHTFYGNFEVGSRESCCFL
jgi:hypothetical protein